MAAKNRPRSFRTLIPDLLLARLAVGDLAACSGGSGGGGGEQPEGSTLTVLAASLLAFGRMGLLGEHLQVRGVQLGFTTAAVVLAELFVVTHFYVRQAAVSFAGIDCDVEEAAMVDGAGRVKVFSKITIPLAFPALVAGAVTA